MLEKKEEIDLCSFYYGEMQREKITTPELTFQFAAHKLTLTLTHLFTAHCSLVVFTTDTLLKMYQHRSEAELQ